MTRAEASREAEDTVVRLFAERLLPSRGWAQVLIAGGLEHRWAEFLAERGYDVTVMEPDARSLEEMRRRLSAGRLSATLLPLAPSGPIAGRYAAIFCSERVLDEAPDRREAMVRLAGALTRQGYLFAAGTASRKGEVTLAPGASTDEGGRTPGLTRLGRAADSALGRAGLDLLAARGWLWPLQALRPLPPPPGQRRRLTERGVLWSLKRARERLVTTASEACIEGFPRSGNTFSVFVFRQWNPRVRLADHLHTPLQVRRAVRLGVPACVLVRRPLEVVAALTLNGRVSDDACFRSYIGFHRRLLPLRNGFVTCRFEEITEDPSIVVTRLNDRFGTSFASAPLTSEGKEWVLSALRAGTHPRTAGLPDLFGAYPTDDKERSKDARRERLSRHRLLAEAEAVYAALCADAR